MIKNLLQRFPHKSEISRVFWAAVLPIHIWTIIALLREIPGYILRFRLSEILIITAYSLSFALIESILVTGLFVLLGCLLPGKFLRDLFTVKSSFMIWITSIWIAIIHVLPFIYEFWNFQLALLQVLIFLWVMSYAAMVLLSLKIASKSKFRKRINQIIDNLTLLSGIYFAVDIVSVIVIFTRYVLISLETK